MEGKINFFENGDYKFIMNLINDKMHILKNYEDFNIQYTRLYDVIDEFEIDLDEKQKEKFNEIMRLFYNTEEYYFALVYSLGVKYAKDLEKM